MMPPPEPGQQVIVLLPAHDEGALIGATIDSLRCQTRPPDRMIVACDNCTDNTQEAARAAGAETFVTVGNQARKAGAINQALSWLLPGLDDRSYVLIMDADSQLSRTWIESAIDALDHDRRVAGVCGTYLGLNEPGLLKQLQRNEFVRASRLVPRRADLWVLSGTGSMFPAPVLRLVAGQRGRGLPGRPGDIYDRDSVTEDYEMTLALKTLGYRVLCPPGCAAATEVMPTWRLLFRQRLRWQAGTLTALRTYGFTGATWSNWARQLFFYVRYAGQLACWCVLGYSMSENPAGHMSWWIAGMLTIIYAERLLTVRKAGMKGVALAALLLPEWIYGMFDGSYLISAVVKQFTAREVSWGHVARDLP